MAKSLKVHFMPTQGYFAYQERQRKKRQRITNLRNQGRYGEADLLMINGFHLLFTPASRQAYYTVTTIKKPPSSTFFQAIRCVP